MILSADKGMYQAALLSEKELTTRLNLPVHIAVGKVWAIVPKRAAPAWWVASQEIEGDWETIMLPRGPINTMSTRQMGIPYGSVITEPRTYWKQLLDMGYDLPTMKVFTRWLNRKQLEQARIRIDGYWQTPLQRMTEPEALQEGVGSVEEYSKLWDRINNKKGIRWADNPTVWRIKFSLPQELCIAVSKVGREAILAAANPVLEAA